MSLRDPDARRRIKQDIESEDATGWENSWQLIPGPEAILIGAVQNPALRRFQGKTLAEVSQAWGREPIDALLDFAGPGQGLHLCRRVRDE